MKIPPLKSDAASAERVCVAVIDINIPEDGTQHKPTTLDTGCASGNLPLSFRSQIGWNKKISGQGKAKQGKQLDSIEGFILVGGASSRMGRDKSKLMLGRLTLVQSIANELKKVTSEVILVGRNADDLELMSGLRSNKDVYEKWGALGGVHAALASCKTAWALITACDLPFVTADLFMRMISFSTDFEAVAPIQDDGYPQPLCALYRLNPCLERSAQLIQAGERRPVNLLESVRTRWVAFEELRNLNGSDHFFDNINTPEDYVRATMKGERGLGQRIN